MKEHDDAYYQELTFSDNAVRGLHPILKAQQEKNRANKQELKQALDDEIISWVSQQPLPIKQHINDMLRREMQFIQQQQSVAHIQQ